MLILKAKQNFKTCLSLRSVPKGTGREIIVITALVANQCHKSQTQIQTASPYSFVVCAFSLSLSLSLSLSDLVFGLSLGGCVVAVCPTLRKHEQKRMSESSSHFIVWAAPGPGELTLLLYSHFALFYGFWWFPTFYHAPISFSHLKLC